ncbi:MAG: hypothetical protein R6X18_01915 [Chloroflexota bacterium]
MDQKQVEKNLFKKMSALRATLTDEEQTLLDALLIGEHEVSAHGLTAAQTAAKATAKATDEDESLAHGLTAAQTAAKATAKATDEDESLAHGLTAAQTAAKATAKATDEDEALAHNLLLLDNVTLHVTYNNEKEVYELN